MNRIRVVTHDDVPFLLELEGRLFENSMNETMLVRELEVGTGLVWTTPGGGVYGYALVRKAGDQLDLTRLGVAPEAQGLGIGAKLLLAVIVQGKTVILTVKKDNKRALRLYRHHGFEIVGSLNDHAAWVLRRDAQQGVLDGDACAGCAVESPPAAPPSETT
jgi:ribosomal-protein-alanine N-acetyltransferase